MNTQDLKIYAFNLLSLVVSFSKVEMALKLILLIASIIYTAQRIWISYNERKKTNK